MIKTYKRYPLFFALSFIVVVLIMLAFQGFDVCDEGWYMSFYQQMFNAPETVEYNFAFWLSGVIGGIWYQVFPNGGILSFRFLSIIVQVLTIIMAYRVLVKFIDKYLLILGICVVVFTNNFGYLAFYYNHLSGLLAVLSVFFMVKGLKKLQLLYFIIAGFIVALNVFARLPNVLLFVMALVLPMQSIFNSHIKANVWAKQLWAFLLGAILGFGLVLIALYALNHFDIIKQAIWGIIEKGKQADSNHNLKTLLRVYIWEYKQVLKVGIKLVLLFFILSKGVSFFKGKPILKFVLLAAGFAFFSYLVYKQTIEVLYALSLIGALAVIFTRKIDAHFKLFAMLALVVLVFLPMGSDGGFHNAGYMSLWLAFPLFLWVSSQTFKLNFNFEFYNNLSSIDIDGTYFKKITILFVVSFLAIKSYRIFNEAYFDKGSRLKKVYKIDNELARNIYTTKERAEVINEVLSQLNKHVKENDYLLAYDNVPMLNFLTKTRPYMGISWVWVYDSVTFKNKLNQAESEIKELPIVVQQKFQTIVNFSKPVSDYMDENKQEGYIYKQGRVKAMNSFLKRNNYKVIWSNSYFNILKPINQNQIYEDHYSI